MHSSSRRSIVVGLFDILEAMPLLKGKESVKHLRPEVWIWICYLSQSPTSAIEDFWFVFIMTLCALLIMHLRWEKPAVPKRRIQIRLV